ncbi:MAG: hypothetical protein IKW74_03945 [Thermoguttaceae bacterium]|nr:hypothetical protein [Thermoguttaceae bacterium]
MNVWNKVLIVLLCVTSLIFFWLVAQRFVLGKTWEEKIVKLDKDLEAAQLAVDNLTREIFGDSLNTERSWAAKGLKQQLEYIRGLQNGTVWTNCEPINISQAGNQVTVSYLLPGGYAATHVQKNGLVYIFDSGVALDSASETAETASQFLGTFWIESVNDMQVSLVSVGSMTQAEVDAINNSIQKQNGWIACADRLPVDSPNDIAAWSSDEKSMVLFSSEDQQFLALAEGTVDEAATGQKRLSRDFEYELKKKFIDRDDQNTLFARRQVALTDLNQVVIDQLVSIGADVPAEIAELISQESLNTALAANKTETYAAQKERLTEEAAAMVHERDLVKSSLDRAEAELKATEAKIAGLLQANVKMAAEIAQAEIENAEKIILDSEERTAARDDSAMIIQQKALLGI